MTRITATRLGLTALFALLVLFPAAPPAVAMRWVDDPDGATPFASAARSAPAPAEFPPVTVPDPVVAWMVGQVDRDTIYGYVGDLSGEWSTLVRGKPVTITTRDTASGTPIQNAAWYAGDHLAALGLGVEYHRWGPSTAPNVIGQKTGTTNPGAIYMITAHLDDMSNGTIAPGADDNASGSSAVLVAADILSQFDWNCTLRFALWTGEEQGLLGSDKYALRAKNTGENILGALNLDMIGWNGAGTLPDMDLHAKGSMPATVDLANQAASVIRAYGIGLLPEVRADGTGSSDHASFWKYGYNAILGIEDYYPDERDFNPYYHQTADQVEKLDMVYMTEFVKAMVAELAHMSACLVTGTLQGQVSAAHDGSPMALAQLTLTDAAGRAYTFNADAAGAFSQPVPPGSYEVEANAYGYGSGVARGLTVAANDGVTHNLTLVALPPSAPETAAGVESGEVTLSWPHRSPNTEYAVRRSADPYFELAVGDLVTTTPAAHAPAPSEMLAWRDAESGAGDTGINHFYVVVGQNAAGAGEPSNRVGEFDYALVAP